MNEQEQQSATPSEGGEDQGAGKKRRRRRRRSRRPGEDGPQGSEPRAEGDTADDQGDDDDSEDEGGSPRSDGNGQATAGDDVRKKKRRKKKRRPEGQPTTADGAPQADQAPREQQPREPREPREQQPREPREQQPREPREPRGPREQQQREPRQGRDQQRRPDGNRPQQGAKPEGEKPARPPRGSVLARRAQRLDMGVHKDDIEEQVVPAAPTINTSSVDTYVNSHRGWQREVLMKLRDMIRACAQESTENISWSQPVFDLNGPMCYLKAFTDHVNFGFWRGTELDDPEGLLVGDLTKMRHVKISSVNDVNRERFESFIRQAAKLNREKGDPTV